MTISQATIIRLEKIAVDNGFDIALPRQDDWLGFGSTRAPLRIWLTAVKDGLFIAALSHQNVTSALTDHGIPMQSPLPSGAAGARGVTALPALHGLVRRAFALSRTLPDELLHSFERQIATLGNTEIERVVRQRVGQDVFRRGLLDYWEGRCAITGLAVPELLRASHIKPWAHCESDAERLDVFNGLLLAPHLDAAFDAGLITVAEDGVVRVSNMLAANDRGLLGLDVELRLRSISERHRSYLPYHAGRIFVG